MYDKYTSTSKQSKTKNPISFSCKGYLKLPMKTVQLNLIVCFRVLITFDPF